ncbi:MAG: hypothetical protein MUF67_13735 [Desulfobacterales bacterium]|nr:hypothetical protein [Desulfobacterales bacterium]
MALLLALGWIGLSGCAALLSNAAADFSDDLSYAILNADDLETVEAGGPAYLLMVDGLIHAAAFTGRGGPLQRLLGRLCCR